LQHPLRGPQRLNGGDVRLWASGLQRECVEVLMARTEVGDSRFAGAQPRGLAAAGKRNLGEQTGLTLKL
jgi:hypothetical protein